MEYIGINVNKVGGVHSLQWAQYAVAVQCVQSKVRICIAVRT